MKRILFALLVSLVLLATAAGPVFADGIIIPPPCPGFECPIPERPISQLDIRYHHVTVRIDNQIAVTHVDQVFHNPNNYAIEGTYVFPLPLDAVVNNFTLWVDGQPVEGKVLTAEQARQIYEDTVRELRDPALLEYIGRGALQASVFPIPPDGERRIELEYSQVLTAENGLVKYTYPLNTEKFSNAPIESVTIRVDVRAGQPLRAVYSPSHAVDVQRPDDQQATVTFEQSNSRPDQDFTLMYSVGESEAFHLLSYRDPGDPLDGDGFFLLLLAPRPDAQAQVVAKDVLLVLDHSGSMEGEKFQQAQAALRYILGHLNAEDRFHITAFSSGVEVYSPQLQSASQADEALQWVNSLTAVGSTDINRALLEAAAAADKERPTYLIFLTDGLPTEGVQESQAILDNFQRAAGENIRLFPFGVGYDVDTFLLDSLSQAHHGLSTYVRPGEALDEMLSAFYAKISTPVLTNVALDFGGAQVYDVYPNPLPDLFSGSQVVITGRYRKGGVQTVKLTGLVNGREQTLAFPEQVFIEDSRAIRNAPVGLPRLWATRKIGYLLNQVRLQGNNKELVDQIVRLSIRYGIVTEYTSYLVTEPNALGASAQEQAARDAYNLMATQAPAPAYGAEAVEKAAGQSALSQAEVAAPISQDDSQRVRVVGDKTFVDNDGVWMDTLYDPDAMQTQKVAFLSPDYYQLAASSPELSSALALGERVIVVSGGQVYETVSEDSSVAPVQLPTPVPSVQPVFPTPTGIAPSAIPAQPTPTPGPVPTTGSKGAPIWPCAGSLLALAVIAKMLKGR